MKIALYVIASSLAIGLVWFFALIAVLESLGLTLSETGKLVLLLSLLAAGALVGWRLFAKPPRQ